MSPLALRAGSSIGPLLGAGFREAGISVQPLLEPSQLAQTDICGDAGQVDGQRPDLRDNHFFRRRTQASEPRQGMMLHRGTVHRSA
jgi:hypothetical protein